jgi:hypothetical protein
MEKKAMDENLLKKHILKKIGEKRRKRKYSAQDLKMVLTNEKE